MNRLPTSSAVRLLVREKSRELLKKAKEEPLKKPLKDIDLDKRKLRRPPTPPNLLEIAGLRA